ncbi:L-lactate dehydrogenase complex protein LldG [Pseudonocardia thermophila]|uniref:L-lactate dehydrogenase complex protein LldG n=1 Tax=Pseudonocardia thermophila TaxID=1848 RepID=A0A1M7A0Y0_PSETH|nr:LUD domain-containing protein [Pseudonocardia thermophila]SHL36269.1 L-lactate dehydrogenase complex protein LldG [Pseudonocardia thermophila]
MSARDEILGRIRAALRDVPATETPADIAVDRPAPAAASPADVDTFVERVADYRARVVRCTPDELAAHIAAECTGRVLVPADLPTELWPAGAVPDHALPVTELDDVDAVLTTAALGIAETGTIVLDHDPGQGRRAATLVPDRHVCIVRADQVVPDVPSAIAKLDPTRPQTWISGPSATSDIELDRVEGVHGPRNLVVLLLG